MIAPWSIATTPSRRATEPWISELLPEPATPVTTTSTPSGMSTSTSCEVVGGGAAHLELVPDGARTARFRRRPVVEVPAGQRCRSFAVPSTLPSNSHLAAGRAGARAEVDHVVGDRDRLRLVLDHQHGVALVAQLQQQAVHPLDVVRVQPDRRLVEDVGHVGERGAEVADHLGALRLAARQRARRAVEREVAEPDLDERVERPLQRREQRRDGRLAAGRAPTRRGR